MRRRGDGRLGAGGETGSGNGRLVVVGVVIHSVSGRVGAGRFGTTVALSQDKFRGGVFVTAEQEDVGSCAVEEGGQDCRHGTRTVVAEDALLDDAAGYFETGLMGDRAQNLIEAGVVGANLELSVGEGDFGVVGDVCSVCGGRGRGLGGRRCWKHCGQRLSLHKAGTRGQEQERQWPAKGCSGVLQLQHLLVGTCTTARG